MQKKFFQDITIEPFFLQEFVNLVLKFLDFRIKLYLDLGKKTTIYYKMVFAASPVSSQD